MNKQYRLVIIVIVTLIIASLAYLTFTRPTSAPAPAITTETPSAQEPAQVAEEPAPASVKGSYETYSADKVASTQGTKLLFFHAPWCPQCRALESSINSDGVPAGTTIFKVDYDSNQTLRQRYGVTIQTTVVRIDDSGDKVDSFVAYDDPSIEAVERELLQ